MHGSLRVLAAAGLAAVVAACGAAPSPSSPTAPTEPPPTGATGAPTGPTTAPSSGPGRTPVPGFEDWETINPQAVRISRDGDDLVMELLGPRLWFNAERGVLFHEPVTGDFLATATVLTHRTSDPDAAPGSDGTIQLAGLMARTAVPAENYVFIVTGSIGMSTGIETKTTTSSTSVYVQRGPGADGDAELRLCRQEEVFTLSWRPPGSEEDWTRISTFERPDLPEALQVGVNIYTDDVPDITARFQDLSIGPLPDGTDC